VWVANERLMAALVESFVTNVSFGMKEREETEIAEERERRSRLPEFATLGRRRGFYHVIQPQQCTWGCMEMS